MSPKKFYILAYGIGVLAAVATLTEIALPIMSVAVSFWWGATCATTILGVGAILLVEWFETPPTILSPDTPIDCFGNILPRPEDICPPVAKAKEEEEESYW